MRLRQFSVAISCALVVTGVAGLAKDVPSKTESKKPMPIIAPPTAEWPVFPVPDSKESPKPVQQPEPAGSDPVKTDGQSPPAADVSPAGVAPAPSGEESATKEASVSPPAALTPAQMEPHKRPVPAGYDAAAALFKQKKFAEAQKAFEKIIKSGTADVNTHLCLAHCFLQQRLYSKAVKEFDWLGEYAKNSMTLRNTCGATARTLRYHMSGVCPSPCIKANDPRWHVVNGKRWITIRYSSKVGMNYSEYHIGEIIANENGVPVSKGQCPTCGGTGQISKLKDGDPMPRL